MPKISVIVPVYNTEKYLKKCLESILNQTYQDFEIIVVNDGSTDNSIKIIKEYSEKYPNIIRYFEKENGGLSSARNYGIEKSGGEYLSFIDSDDFIDKNLFESLEEEINKNTELIKFKLITVNSNYEEIKKIDGPTFTDLNGQEAFNKLVFKDVLLEPACIYLYKKELFTKNNFKFALNTYHEDFGLIPIIILNSKTVSSLDIYGYYYMQTEESITRNKDYKKTVQRAMDLLKHYDNMLEQTNKNNLNKETIRNIKQYYTNAILNVVPDLNGKEKNRYIKEIKERKLIKNIKVRNARSLIRKIFLKIKYL